MSTAGTFIASLRAERLKGNVSQDTEHHLKNELRRLGWNAADDTLAQVIVAEITQLEREANTLRTLRDTIFGAGCGAQRPLGNA
jgi:hypothetical protein